MRLFFVEAVVALVVVLVVMATVFRSGRARETLRFGWTVLCAYALVILGLAALRLWREGF